MIGPIQAALAEGKGSGQGGGGFEAGCKAECFPSFKAGATANEEVVSSPDLS